MEQLKPDYAFGPLSDAAIADPGQAYGELARTYPYYALD
jgi:hypothetical protein